MELCTRCNWREPIWGMKMCPYCRYMGNAQKRRRYQDPEYRLKQLGYQKKWRLDNPEKKLEIDAKWRKENLEHRRAYSRKYVIEHREERSAYSINRYHTNVEHRLAANLRSRLYQAVQNDSKSGSAVRDLGCSIPTFRLFIENQFEEGMSWDNYGEWHLDHVLPLASFDLTDRGDFQTAVHYLNYQPLWAKDNAIKGANI